MTLGYTTTQQVDQSEYIEPETHEEGDHVQLPDWQSIPCNKRLIWCFATQE